MVQWNFGDEAERLGGYISKRVLSGLLIIVILTSMFTTPMLVETKNNNYMYAKTTDNIRKKPSIKSKSVGKIYWNDKVKVIKKINKKWYLVRYKKKNRYVCAKYLRQNL